MNNNFKVKALVSDGEWFSKGDILEFEDGRCTYKNGNESSCYGDFKDFINSNKCWEDYLILLQEDNTHKEFTKQDLKTGMVVELRNGKCAMVLLGTENGDIISGTTWFPIDGFGEKLTRGVDYDVIKIYQPTSNRDFLYDGKIHIDEANLIWERKEEPQPKEMTVEEIEKELGYSIKVVK